MYNCALLPGMQALPVSFFVLSCIVSKPSETVFSLHDCSESGDSCQPSADLASWTTIWSETTNSVTSLPLPPPPAIWSQANGLQALAKVQALYTWPGLFLQAVSTAWET
jgi:hypothetical protein